MILQPTTIAGRLLVTACLFVTAALIIAGVVISVILHYVVSDQVDQRLQAQANSLASALEMDSGGRLTIAGLDAPPFDRRGSGWYWQIDGQENRLMSRSLGDGSLNAPPPPLDWRQLLSGRIPVTEGREPNGRALHVATLTTSVGQTTVTVKVSAPSSAIWDPLKNALLWLVPSLGSLGLALIGATLLQIRLGLRPLRDLRDSLQAVRSGQKTQVPADQPEELVPVVAELNALIRESEERLSAARLHLANMAHSLKTPLASLSLAIHESGGDAEGTLAAFTEQIEARIRHHLGRARANAGAGTHRSQTDVALHLQDLTAVMLKIYGDKNLQLTLEVEPGTVAACEAADFDELVGNIIDNAFKWASQRVLVKATREGATVTIIIQDDGPGIPEEALKRVLLPGQRLDEAVAGHGFGLSSSQELVTLYGGSISLETSRAKGLCAIIELPAAKAG